MRSTNSVARLGAGRDRPAPRRRRASAGDGRAERGLGDRDRHLGDEVVAVAPVALVLGDPQVHVEVAGSPPRGPAAPRRQPQRRPGVDAGRHVDLVGVLDGDAALAPARRARRHDDLAEAAAAGHGADVTIWPSRLWRTRCTCPVPLQSAHVTGCVPAPAPAAAAVLAALRHPQRDGHGRPEHRLLERRCRRRPPGPGRAAVRARRRGRPATERALAAEEGVEQVVEATPAEDVLDPRPGAGVDARLAEAVVAGPLVGVGQHLVGPGDLLEPLGGGRVVRVGVGVQLAGLGGRPA